MKCSTFFIEEYEYYSSNFRNSRWFAYGVLSLIFGSCILFGGSLIGMLRTVQSDPLFTVYAILFIISSVTTGMLLVTLCVLIIGACCALPK